MAAMARNLLLLALMAACMAAAWAEEEADEKHEEVESTGINCDDGLVVPLWPGTDDMSIGDRMGRGLLYAILMLYLFIGVAIVSDKFMESIETITGNYFLILLFCQKVPDVYIFCVCFQLKKKKLPSRIPAPAKAKSSWSKFGMKLLPT